MKGFTSFLEVLWSCSDDRREIGVAGCRGPLGRDDRVELVRWDNFAANLRVFLLTAKPPAVSSRLVASLVRRFCSAPTLTASNSLARDRLP
jgi:hypothetical protein